MSRRAVLAAFAAFIGATCLAQGAWIHLKARLAQVLIERAWERSERGERQAHPWPWADTVPIARLVVPGASPQEYYVLEGASGRNLAFGPAHDPASVLPGERGNSVISGHRDTSFAFLRFLKPGDRLRIERAGRATWFEVRQSRVVDTRGMRIALDGDVPRLTLVTCYPFAALVPGGPLRWVVTAEAVGGGAAAGGRAARAP